MPTRTILHALVLSCLINQSLLAEEPVFDAIDYASPAKYLVMADSLGDHDAIRKQAAALKTSDDRATLSHVLQWMDSQLKYDGDRAYEWRNYDTVVSEQCYGGCADQAIVCGALLKAAGIPTVWVKTMDVTWIWDFKKKRPFSVWSGHVFLEVFLDDQWVLLDPGAATIYKDYSTGSRILPGSRFAYHKGNDPQQMIMSLQWEAWKNQTASYFNDLDETLLPVDTASATPVRQQCFTIANSPHYQYFGKLMQQYGIRRGPSFNNAYDKYLPLAKGNFLLIETHGGVPIVDVKILKQYFPTIPEGKLTGKVIDGATTLIFIDVEPLVEQIKSMASEPLHDAETTGETALLEEP